MQGLEHVSLLGGALLQRVLPGDAARLGIGAGARLTVLLGPRVRPGEWTSH